MLYSGWISDCEEGLGLELVPHGQGLCEASKNSCPVKRKGCALSRLAIAAFTVNSCVAGLKVSKCPISFHDAGRKWGLISAVTLSHSCAVALVPKAIWISLPSSSPRLQLTLSPFPRSA